MLAFYLKFYLKNINKKIYLFKVKDVYKFKIVYMRIIKSFFVFLSTLIYLLWSYSFSHINFMNDSFHSFHKLEYCDIHNIEHNYTIDNKNTHMWCFWEVSEYGLLDFEIIELNNSITKYFSNFSKNKPLCNSKVHLNKSPPILNSNKTFSFTDIIGIILMLN